MGRRQKRAKRSERARQTACPPARLDSGSFSLARSLAPLTLPACACAFACAGLKVRACETGEGEEGATRGCGAGTGPVPSPSPPRHRGKQALAGWPCPAAPRSRGRAWQHGYSLQGRSTLNTTVYCTDRVRGRWKGRAGAGAHPRTSSALCALHAGLPAGESRRAGFVACLVSHSLSAEAPRGHADGAARLASPLYESGVEREGKG